ncbi:hypothetical protein ACL9RG_00930 [Rouxiella sp. Mn2063]
MTVFRYLNEGLYAGIPENSITKAKDGLHLVNRYRMRYSRAAAAKSAAGFRTP